MRAIFLCLVQASTTTPAARGLSANALAGIDRRGPNATPRGGRRCAGP